MSSDDEDRATPADHHTTRDTPKDAVNITTEIPPDIAAPIVTFLPGDVLP